MGALYKNLMKESIYVESRRKSDVIRRSFIS